MGCQSSKTMPVLTDVSAEAQALHELRLIFNGVAHSDDGKVSPAELGAALALDTDARLDYLMKQAGLSEHHMIDAMDPNVDSRLTWEEFQLLLKTPAVMGSPAREASEASSPSPAAAVQFSEAEKALAYLREVFEAAEVGIDGSVLKHELSTALAQDWSVKQVVKLAGFNSKYFLLWPLATGVEDRITWEEFVCHLNSAPATTMVSL